MTLDWDWPNKSRIQTYIRYVWAMAVQMYKMAASNVLQVRLEISSSTILYNF